MRKNSTFFIMVFLVVMLLSSASTAQTVRGRLQRPGPYGYFPIAGITVGVDGVYFGSSGPDGMYYIYNVPPGVHVLTIYGPFGPITFNIIVQFEPTDIAPINT